LSSLALDTCVRVVACAALALPAAATRAQAGAPVENPTITVSLQGRVLGLDGSPACGALIRSSAGGCARTDAQGAFELEVCVPPAADRVQVTAIGSGGSGSAVRTVLLPASHTVSAGILPLSSGGACQPTWVPTFGGFPGVDSIVRELLACDLGAGPELVVAGDFTVASGSSMARIARWNGSSWASMGDGMDGSVAALALFDSGQGPALHAGGFFTTAGGAPAGRIARWSGSAWEPLGAGLDGDVWALKVWDDGSGPALFVAGSFTTAGGVPANGIARWDGSAWSSLGIGLDGAVYALEVWNGALHAGGLFTAAGGSPADHVARWDGTSWFPLAGGVDEQVDGLAVYDDGGGPALYVAGLFQNAGGQPADHVARWDGTSWSPLGAGTDQHAATLEVLDIGAGPELFAGGWFTSAGGTPTNRIARWNGSSWSAFGEADGAVFCLEAFDDGQGPRIHAGGLFLSTAGLATPRIARLGTSGWEPLETGGLRQFVNDLLVFDDGSGPALYASGAGHAFEAVGGNYIARWNGSSWSPLGAGLDDLCFALAEYDDGGGPALYAGGNFTTAGGVPALHVARWDGAAWSPLGLGVGFNGVSALVAFDDGGGPALYAGGRFSIAGGVAVDDIARWNGVSWSAVGTWPHYSVQDLVVHDSGSGPELYAAGWKGVARWNGTSWVTLGTGLNSYVEALAWYGGALHAAGSFTTQNGGAADGIARWNGTGWVPLGTGLSGLGWGYALKVHDDGRGPRLFVGGWFDAAGGMAAGHVASWDGTAWEPLGGGTTYDVKALEVFDAGAGPALYVGGSFLTCLDSRDSYLAKWACDTTPPVLACAPVFAADELTGPPGTVVTFTVEATDDVDPAPLVVATPPSGSVFPVGTTLVSVTATDAAGNVASCDFPVIVSPKTRKATPP
jgi:hypothetical protein